MRSSGEGSRWTAERRQSARLWTATRSRKGCPECRQRKIKCDEQGPQCGQCRKGDRECHIQDSVFKRQKIAGEEKKIQGRVRDDKHSIVETDVSTGAQSPRLRDSSESREYANEVSRNDPSTLSGAYENSVLQIGRPIGENFSVALTTQGASSHADQEISERMNAPPSMSGNSALLVPLKSGTSVDFEPPFRFSPIASCPPKETVDPFEDPHVELFFMRHYSECIAPWMDLLYRYEVFSREVLTLAREHPILRFAACAVAAKQLGQLRNPLSYDFRTKIQIQIADRIHHGKFGFSWYGSKYYEKAIQTLVQSIRPEEGSTACSPCSNVSQTDSYLREDLMLRAQGQDPIIRLLGTCILIQFEQLSANREAWSSHLTGFSQLLDLIDDEKILQDHPVFKQVYPWTKQIMEVKAGFWNFVVNDLEESFVSRRCTRIDTENLALWRNMGLLLEDDGSLTYNSYPYSLSTIPEHARDKVLSYFLIRLLCKLVDMTVILKPFQFLQAQVDSPGCSHTKQEYLNLRGQFDTWHKMLSAAYHPDGEFAGYDSDYENGRSKRPFGSSIWFSNDLCATTMIYYHMARMVLLIYRPLELLETSCETDIDILKIWADLAGEVRHHVLRVVSIVRGTTCDAIKLRAIQPLYVAGRCTFEDSERRRLIEMLLGIQETLGIATNYRIEALLQEWRKTPEELGLNPSIGYQM